MKPSTEAQGGGVPGGFLLVGLTALPTPLLLLLAVVIFYLIPTVLEFSILRYPSLGVTAMLLGDLSGCIGIYVALKRKKLAVILYLALTAAECWLYATQMVSAQLLVYLMDLVPTAILAGAILKPKSLILLKR